MTKKEEKDFIDAVVEFKEFVNDPRKLVKRLIATGKIKKKKMNAKICFMILGNTTNFSEVCKLLGINERKEKESVRRHLEKLGYFNKKMVKPEYKQDGLPRFGKGKRKIKIKSTASMSFLLKATLPKTVIDVSPLFPKLTKKLGLDFRKLIRKRKKEVDVKKMIEERDGLYNKIGNLLKNKLESKKITKKKFDKSMAILELHKKSFHAIKST